MIIDSVDGVLKFEWAKFHHTSKRQRYLYVEKFRCAHRRELHESIARTCREMTTSDAAQALGQAGVPHSPITPIEGVMDLAFVAESGLRTRKTDGGIVRLPPAAVSTAYLDECGGELRFAPAYGEHTDSVLAEAGLDAAETTHLRERGVIA